MTIEAELIELNEKSVNLEQVGAEENRAEEAYKFFESRLSDHLIFRRANGIIVGKREFMEGLRNKSPFKSRVPEHVVVSPIGDRAFVSLIVVATRQDNSVHRYRNIRLFSNAGGRWIMEFWYNYEIPDQAFL